MPVFVLILLLISTVFLSAEDSVYQTEKFSLTLPANGTQIGLLASFSMPVVDGFAPNVNVIRQAYNGTLEQYLALSKKQLDAMQMQLKAEEIGEVIVLEYTGTVDGQRLHWYQKAIPGPGVIYVVTATGLANRWKSDGTALITAVESFGLN